MHADDFRSALNANPFRPFLVHMSSGRVIGITNPDLVVVSSTGRSAFAYHARSDGFDLIDMRMVEAIEFSNGSRRRRSA